MGLFVVAGDMEGNYRVKIEFCDSADHVLASMDGIEIQGIRSRQDSVEFGIQTGLLPVSAPGRYTFKLYFNGELATVKDIDAEVLSMPGGLNG